MNNYTKFSYKHLKFMELFKIACDFDCLYLLDFYCVDLFDHDNLTQLSEHEADELAEAAQRDIFAHAIKKGFDPIAFSQVDENRNEFLC